MNQEELKGNLLNANQWIRVLFMAGFALAAWCVLFLLVVLVLVQMLITLISGEPNPNLQRTGYQFGCYLQEIIQYLVYNTNVKPFPFNEFPGAQERKDTAEAPRHSGHSQEYNDPDPMP
jgi:hypothetical protein